MEPSEEVVPAEPEASQEEPAVQEPEASQEVPAVQEPAAQVEEEAPAVQEVVPEAAPKRRGRPPGVRNKPKVVQVRSVPTHGVGANSASSLPARDANSAQPEPEVHEPPPDLRSVLANHLYSSRLRRRTEKELVYARLAMSGLR